jgi:DNA-binding LytR/AlgR family response regulator
MRCLIVDDNDLARMALRNLADQSTILEVVAECDDAMKAYEYITKNPVDIIFLDVEMPGMSGIELLRLLPEKPIVILSTSKRQYAVEAFELSVSDYLVKPVSMSRFTLAVQKAEEIFKSSNVELAEIEPEHFFIKENKTFKKINLSDILWIEAMGDYVKIKTESKWHIVHSTLKTLEQKINGNKMMRVHRSYLVSLEKIDYLDQNSIYIQNTPIPIAETYKATLLNKLTLL